MNVLVSADPAKGEGLLGLGVPLFYSVVLLLDGEERIRFHGDELETWVGTEALVPMTPATFAIDPAAIFRNQTIAELQHDDLGDIVVVLGNGTTLQVDTTYGTTIRLGTTAQP